jgi:CRISPR-associated protein Csd1
MILSRLYDLAIRKKLTEDPSTEDQPVPYIVKLNTNGDYIGIESTHSLTSLPGKKKDAPPKTMRDKGRILSVPRAHGSPGVQGFARFFVDTLPRVLPFSDEEKSARSRATFWKQINQAAEATNHPSLRAVQEFGRALSLKTDLAQRVKADVERLESSPNDRCTFEVVADQGKCIVQLGPIRDWYRKLFVAMNSARQADDPIGVCQITGEIGPLPATHAIKLSGIPGGSPMGISVVSNDKAAFESYGLEKATNAGIGYPAADGYARALTALIQNKVPGAPRSSLRVGNAIFLYWTRQDAETDFMNLFENPDPAQVEQLIHSIYAGKEDQGLSGESDFFLLGLSGNAARAIVRDYLEAPLPRVKANLARWFRELRIADLSKEGAGRPTSRFPLWLLAASTALESDQVAPETPVRLLSAALKGEPLCESLLAACIRRLRAEGSQGFRAARLALIKLFLLRRNIDVTETLSLDERHPAYVYGRMLAIFEQIQYAALGDVNANVVDKFFGTFSAAPALVFSRLFANSQNHLRKIKSEKPGSYVALDRLLAEVTSLHSAAPPKGQLSLQDQGRFALGYYHQRAKRFEEIAERKAAKAEAQGNRV